MLLLGTVKDYRAVTAESTVVKKLSDSLGVFRADKLALARTVKISLGEPRGGGF